MQGRINPSAYQGCNFGWQILKGDKNVGMPVY